jgi:DNA-binding IclR family transcriptional regulator
MPVTEYRVQVLDRALSIVDVLAASDRALGASEISEHLRLNKSTVHRLMAVLERKYYVERDVQTGKYRLGLKLAELGSVALSRFDLHAAAAPFVERLMRETGETAHLGVLRQNEVISLTNAESGRSVRTPATVGRRSPVHCTSLGKALLAFQPPQQINEFLRRYRFTGFTPNTIRRLDRFRAELEKVRSHGFAMDNEEFEEGLRCVGAPVRDHSGNVIAAISIAGPAFRISPNRMPGLIRSVVNVAADMSESLWYRAEAAPRSANGSDACPKKRLRIR